MKKARRRPCTCDRSNGDKVPSRLRTIEAETVTTRWSRTVERTRNSVDTNSGLDGSKTMSVVSSFARNRACHECQDDMPVASHRVVKQTAGLTLVLVDHQKGREPAPRRIALRDVLWKRLAVFIRVDVFRRICQETKASLAATAFSQRASEVSVDVSSSSVTTSGEFASKSNGSSSTICLPSKCACSETIGMTPILFWPPRSNNTTLPAKVASDFLTELTQLSGLLWLGP